MHKCALIAATLIAAGSPALAADPNGDWRVADGTAVIRMAPCYDLHVEAPTSSNADPRYALCGVIAWTKSPSGNDDKNPDPSKRSRPIIGLPILLDMKPDGRGRWNGEVYNAESGQTYTSYVYLKSDDVLRIEGCLLVFCGGEDWTRTQLSSAAGASPAPGASGSSPLPNATRPPAQNVPVPRPK